MPSVEGDAKLRGFGFGFDLGSIRITQRLLFDVSAEAHFRTYSIEPDASNAFLDGGEAAARDPFYLPVVGGISYLVTPRVRVSGLVEYDPRVSLLGSAVGGGQLYGSKATAVTSVLPWLMVDAGVGVDSLSSGTNQFRSRTTDVSGWVGVRMDRR